MTFEIGPIGLPGTKGEKGSPGLFGVRAEKGNKGLPGFQGLKGFSVVLSLHKKWSFSLKISSVNVTKSAETADLATFTEEILNGE